MTVLLPHLDRDSARSILEENLGRPLEEVTMKQPRAVATITYSPVGGTPLSQQQLSALRGAIVTLAVEHGFPSDARRVPEFEGRLARLLHRELPMTPHEAAHEDAWSYLTCCWLLDVAVWRFGEEADERRFVGNVNRNTFRRLWWRSEVLGPDLDLERLGEDELVNIMERPTISGDRRLARTVAAEFLRRVEIDAAVDRMLLMREAMKRLLRLTPFVSLEGLSDVEVEAVVGATFDAAASGLAGRHASMALPSACDPPTPSPVVTRVERDVMVTVESASSNGDRTRGDEGELEPAGQVAIDIARKVGRVTNMTLREVAPINVSEAREILRALVDAGQLERRGAKRGTHYVMPEVSAASTVPTSPPTAPRAADAARPPGPSGRAPSSPQVREDRPASSLRRLLRRRGG